MKFRFKASSIKYLHEKLFVNPVKRRENLDFGLRGQRKGAEKRSKFFQKTAWLGLKIVTYIAKNVKLDIVYAYIFTLEKNLFLSQGKIL